MKQIYVTFLLLFTIFITSSLKGQEVTLYEQFNGRYDFTFIGNTLNYSENGTFVFCGIRTEATANLQLQPDDTIEKAYLYWAGSGSGDFNVKLNDVEITAERNSNVIQSSSGLPFFSAFKDVTDQVLSAGNGNYTVSELDVSAILPLYCPNATNFAGWALLIVYKNDSLPLNQLNIYDGLEYIGGGKFDLSIQLTNLNVIDNQDAKIGFIAWEGDSGIAIDETLQINGNQLSNTLNPWNNAFNGTNSITNSTELYNMDLDIYSIENNIQIGDETAEIKMTSGQDFVMINAIVTKLNSQLPDATIIIDEVTTSCNSRIINIEYTVQNYNATEILPSGTPIAIYCNGEFLAYAETINPIAINESYSDRILVVVPEIYGDTLEITIVVDDLGNGLGIVTEIIETNNTAITNIILHRSPSFNSLDPITICTTGFNRGVYNFSHYEELVKVNPTDTVLFFETIENALNGANAITNTTHFETITPKEIFITVTNATCGQVVTSFNLLSKKCPPLVYNFISANEDSYNDSFHIVGLKDVFPNHEIHIYNRWGVLLWKGNNTSENWKGEVHYGLLINGKIVPDGTYYYVIYLNDTEYPKPLVGFVYITH